MKSKITTDDGLIVSEMLIVYQETSQTFFISISTPVRVDHAFVISSTIGKALYVHSFLTTFEKSAVIPWAYTCAMSLSFQWGEVIRISISIHSRKSTSLLNGGTVIETTVASFLLIWPQILMSKFDSIPCVLNFSSSILEIRSELLVPCIKREITTVLFPYFLSITVHPSERDETAEVTSATSLWRLPACTAIHTLAQQRLMRLYQLKATPYSAVSAYVWSWLNRSWLNWELFIFKRLI